MRYSCVVVGHTRQWRRRDEENWSAIALVGCVGSLPLARVDNELNARPVGFRTDDKLAWFLEFDDIVLERSQSLIEGRLILAMPLASPLLATSTMSCNGAVVWQRSFRKSCCVVCPYVCNASWRMLPC